jgi:hypothetical protein
VGELFELPLAAELEASWAQLARERPVCQPVAERIAELRAAGRTSLTASLAECFWQPPLHDGTVVCVEPDVDDDPVPVICPELSADGAIAFYASELGFAHFDGEVALYRYASMSRDDKLPLALARRAGEPGLRATRWRTGAQPSGRSRSTAESGSARRGARQRSSGSHCIARGGAADPGRAPRRMIAPRAQR